MEKKASRISVRRNATHRMDLAQIMVHDSGGLGSADEGTWVLELSGGDVEHLRRSILCREQKHHMNCLNHRCRRKKASRNQNENGIKQQQREK